MDLNDIELCILQNCSKGVMDILVKKRIEAYHWMGMVLITAIVGFVIMVVVYYLTRRD